jgi:two-component system, LytTR family, response regulator
VASGGRRGGKPGEFAAAMKLRAVIADDEPLARERVRSLLAGDSDVEIVAECEDGAQTLDVTRAQKPDLLFLDVQMPRLNGFEVLGALEPEEMPVVIFTTAHEQHALRAFEVSALDYLLKPFTEARFQAAVQRAKNQFAKAKAAGNAAPRPADSQLAARLAQLHLATPGARILVRSPERILFLKPAEIDYVEAAGNYVVLHAGKERHILRETTSAMESRLTPSGFMRISRSTIVNLAQIREAQPLGAGQYVVLLKNGARLEMTCSLGDLQTRLGQI